MAKQIGIYSGSFDPVHEGHIAFAKEAAAVCGLDTVIFMPERFPRNKPNVSPISERLKELEVALASTPFRVLNAHADQFTVDETLTELEALYPETEFTFLVGSDVALNLEHWSNIDRIACRYKFAVGMRSGDNSKTVEKAMRVIKASWTLIRTEHGHLSSKQLRQGV